MTEQQENYIHIASCIENLNKSWNILQEIKKSKEKSIFVACSFQLALIEYAKPFTSAYGDVKKWKLDKRFIPSKYEGMHNQIIDARNHILAHSDLTIKEAKVVVKDLKSTKFVGIVQNVIDPTSEFKNIDEIILLIEQTLNNMYVEQKQLEKELQLT